MRIILSGGGTGGHIYPALAIAGELLKRNPGSEVLYVGSSGGMEAGLAVQAGYAFRGIEVEGFVRKLTLRHFLTAAKAVGALRESLQILREFRPQVVIGTGGYVCGPVLLAAVIQGVPALVQEQNTVPGMTNRLLGRLVQKVALGYEAAAKGFSCPDKLVYTGNPIRQDIFRVSRAEGLAELGWDDTKKIILVAGGSRGARSVNRAMKEVYRIFFRQNQFRILHVTGEKDYNELVEELKQQGTDPSDMPEVILRPYLHNMPAALAVADLAVFRAGALGLAELTAKGIPSILIPYPYATANHQEHNARVLAECQAAVVIRDTRLSGSELAKTMQDLLQDEQRLAAMRQAALRLGKPKAAESIAVQVEAMVQGNGKI